MWCALSDEKSGLYFSVVAWLESDSRETHEHILLSQFLRLTQIGAPSSCIYFPQEQGSPVIPPGPESTKAEVEVNLLPTVSRPVCLRVELPSGTYDKIFLFFLTILGFLIWSTFSDERMGLNLLVQLLPGLARAVTLSGPSSAELTTIFYCLIWDTPNLEGQSSVFISPGTGCLSYAPGYWVRRTTTSSLYSTRTDCTGNVFSTISCPLIARETTSPRCCSLTTAVLFPLVYTNVSWKLVLMSQQSFNH
jgi:hypothetical protein